MVSLNGLTPLILKSMTAVAIVQHLNAASIHQVGSSSLGRRGAELTYSAVPGVYPPTRPSLERVIAIFKCPTARGSFYSSSRFIFHIIDIFVVGNCLVLIDIDACVLTTLDGALGHHEVAIGLAGG